MALLKDSVRESSELVSAAVQAVGINLLRQSLTSERTLVTTEDLLLQTEKLRYLPC